MVQITFAQPTQQRVPMSKGEMTNAALSEGLGSGLNAMIQDMHKQKDLQRVSDYNSKINKGLAQAAGHPELGDLLGANDPKDSIVFLKNLSQYGGQQKANSLSNAFRDIQMGRGQGNLQQNLNVPMQQQPRTLQPGEGMMLPQEQMPATEDYAPNIPMQVPNANVPQQGQMNPQQAQMTPAQKLALVDQAYDQIRPTLEGTENIKLNDQQYQKIRNSIIQEGNLQARERTATATEAKPILESKKFEYTKREKVLDTNRGEIKRVIDPIMDRENKNNALAQQLPVARRSVESGNSEGIKQWLAAKEFSPWLSPEAALVNYLSKENIGNVVERIGGKANMFLERLSKSATVGAGHPRLTGLVLLDFQEAEMRQDAKEAAIAQELSDKYTNSKKILAPGKFQNEINRRMKEWVPKNVEYTALKIQETLEKDISEQQMLTKARDPASARGATPMTTKRFDAMVKREGSESKAYKVAKELGYTFPKNTSQPE